MRLLSFLAVCCCVPFLGPLAQDGTEHTGRGAPTVRLPRAADTITIDAELSELAWATAVRLTGFS